MDEENKDVQSRREFFKQAARMSLPIVGVIVASSCSPAIAKLPVNCASDNKNDAPQGCDGNCSHSCDTTCTGYCQGSCFHESPCSHACYGVCETECTSNNQ